MNRVELIKDNEELKNIVFNYSYIDAAIIAIKKINDEIILKDISLNHPDSKVRKEANRKLTVIRKEAIKNINDENTLMNIVNTEESPKVREEAIKKINDENFLIEILKNEKSYNSRKNIVQRINNESVLSDIAKNDSDADIHIFAIRKIDDKSVLEYIANHDSDFHVRQEAKTRLL